MVIGNRYNARGELIVDGNGSRLNIQGNMFGSTFDEGTRLTVGGDGEGRLIVRNGADVLINSTGDGRGIFQIGAGRSVGSQFDDMAPTSPAILASPSSGYAEISGAGSTLTLTSANAGAERGNIIFVGREAGATGELRITDGAQVLNSVGSLNSRTVVGGTVPFNMDSASGLVVVDGKGNTNTLFDAGHEMSIGGQMTSGLVQVLDGAVLRADTVSVFESGILAGNATIDGDVVVFGSPFPSAAGGFIDAGDGTPGSVGTLAITGDLDVTFPGKGTVVFDIINGANDRYNIGGSLRASGIEFADINVTGGLQAGGKFVLMDASAGLDLGFFFHLNFEDRVSGLDANQGFLLAQVDNQLIFEAMDTTGNGPAILDFGAAELNGVTHNLDGIGGTADGTASGGRFDQVVYFNVNGVSGTAGSDTLTLSMANTVAYGQGGNDILNCDEEAATLDGGSGNDSITGWFFGDVLLGGSGHDNLKGGIGAGEDVLNGGTGNDQLDGGSGADVFVYDTLNFGKDRIMLFENGLDKIDLAVVGLDFSDFGVSTVNGSAVLTLLSNTANTITLVNFNAALVDATDFI